MYHHEADHVVQLCACTSDEPINDHVRRGASVPHRDDDDATHSTRLSSFCYLLSAVLLSPPVAAASNNSNNSNNLNRLFELHSSHLC